ncbi:MAG: discoidin domain-containing protein [Candidatus Bathyarchaeia archaeon]
MKKLLNKKGQFTIIASLLVSIVLVTAIVTTYSVIRNNPTQARPQILGALDEMNLAIDRILEFAVGYYGSILQVTGNTTYAKNLASEYLQSSMENIVYAHLQWSPSFTVVYSRLSASWFNRTSSSEGMLNVTYSLNGLGIRDIHYAASVGLTVTVNPSSTNHVLVNVTCDEDDPCPTLTNDNLFLYNYSYAESAWELSNTGLVVNSVVSTNSSSAYNITLPNSIDPSSYMLQAIDNRGIMVAASTFSQYKYTFSWNQTLYSTLDQDTMAVEVLQNGTLRWLGQSIRLTTSGKPIPPVSVKALHVNQTANGANREVPFQIEDWGSNYQVPAGLTSNASVFSNRQMIVFLANHHVTNVTIWWDGRDVANQTSYAFTNRYFIGDDPSSGVLTNGILTLDIANFDITSTVGSATSTATFMRINGRTPTYGANLAYIIHHGIVRDVIHQEAEWSNGIAGCPNIYSQIIIMLPANATYFTYALRTIFVSSSLSRTVTELSPIQLSSGWFSKPLRFFTENGTSGGYPTVAETPAGDTDLFYNFSSPSTGWMHHWSEYVYGGTGAGIMFSDDYNRMLYTFDDVAGDRTGALSVSAAQRAVWTTPTSVYDRCGQDSSYPASRAIDGDTSSTWRHSTTENHWIELDMGETVSVSRIRIYQSATTSYMWGQSAGVEVYVSNDPDNWGSAVWIGTLNSGGWQSSGAFSAQGRYIRLYSRSTSSSQRFYEVQVEVQERQATIEFNPVERYQASFTYPMDVAWHGAVLTFDGEPIYPESGNVGLWVMAESPPTVDVS